MAAEHPFSEALTARTLYQHDRLECWTPIPSSAKSPSVCFRLWLQLPPFMAAGKTREKKQKKTECRSQSAFENAKCGHVRLCMEGGGGVSASGDAGYNECDPSGYNGGGGAFGYNGGGGTD
eukprot:1583044-Rhodomonas_salina.2